MCRRRFFYGIGIFLLACAVICWGLWFAFVRPIIPKGEVGEVQFEKRVDQLSGNEKREYEIGVYFVPESRSNADSRVIAIDYARFHAKEKNGPPIFFLPGGPGNTYVGKTPDLWKIPYFEKLRAFSDVVLVNQRGCNPHRRDVLGTWRFGSTLKPDSTLEDRVANYKEFAKKTTAYYQDSDIDLSGYNITECAADINDLRKALGYDKIILMGQSFGSQWSFAVMRHHPEIVERAILTGVEPLNHGYDMPSHIMNAIRRIWKHLDTDPAWAPYLPPGGMEQAAEEVLTRLENGGIEVKDARGKTEMVLGPDDFPWDYPAAILELFHGHTERWKDGRESEDGFN
jgi:pimeloyl-ACP methyl ester carboxylesterase